MEKPKDCYWGVMILQAAIKDPTGVVHTLLKPARHHNILHLMSLQQRQGAIQGFITDDNIFVDRIEAASLALKHKQIGHLQWPPNLYSEDLW